MVIHLCSVFLTFDYRSENNTKLFVGRKSGREIEDLILDSEDRKQIANSTRSIAMLAAHRRGGGGSSIGGKENFEMYNEKTRLRSVICFFNIQNKNNLIFISLLIMT